MGVIAPPVAGETPISGVIRNKTLQSAATATGDGAILNVAGMNTVALTLGTTGFSGTVLFEASQDGINYKTIKGRLSGTLYEAMGTGSLTTDTSVNVWRIDVSGYSYFKAPITASAGSITITATATPIAMPDALVGDTVVKTIAAQAITAGTAATVWTPTTGSRFRLLGYAFSVSAAAYPILKDNTSVILNAPLLASAGVFADRLPGRGFRSAAVNNILKLDVSANATVTGYAYGYEE